MNRAEVIKVFEEVDARVNALRPRLEANPDAPLPSGTWRVRDALSHLAARSGPRHEMNHLNDVEAALAPAGAPSGATA